MICDCCLFPDSTPLHMAQVEDAQSNHSNPFISGGILNDNWSNKEVSSDTMGKRPSYKRDDLSVRVDMTHHEIHGRYNAAVKLAEIEFMDTRYNYYKIYLKHLFGPNTNAPIDVIFKKLNDFRKTVDMHMSCTEYTEEMFIRNLITRNNYVSKSNRRPGVTVKLFRSLLHGRDVMVKTYIYDGECLSLDDRMMECFKDEVLFQYYANRIKVGFISPELYSWGQIKKYQFIGDEYIYKCLFLIMEYIPGLTIKESTYTKETMRSMYEKVKEVDRTMMAAGIHHNDLHGGNIMVVEKSPLPEIVIIDFGEASFGPRKPLFV